jgi:fatty acyl-ACP thioesterase B
MALCHVQLLGIAGDGFGATQGMNRNGLIWVVNRMHVEVERYPAWSVPMS